MRRDHNFARFALAARPLVVAAIGAMLVACASGDAPSARATPLVDDLGDTTSLATTPPTRIVSLNPTTTELLFGIGAGARVVGRTTYDVWPVAARAVPDLGPGLRPNVEAVLTANPDLVILYAGEDNRDAARRLRAAGVHAVAYRVDRLADFRRVTLALGAITGDTAGARSMVDTVTATLDRVRAATASLQRPTVFWPLWESPLLSVGGGSFLNELLEIAGARNVYGGLAQPSPAVSMEDLVRRDPDIVLTSATSRARMLASPRWRALRAVRNGKVFIFDSTIVNGPSARVGASAVGLAALLHPGAVTP